MLLREDVKEVGYKVSGISERGTRGGLLKVFVIVLCS